MIKVLILLTVLSAVSVKTTTGEYAFLLDCGAEQIIVKPANGVTLAEARKLADCLGPKVCTLETIKVKLERK